VIVEAVLEAVHSHTTLIILMMSDQQLLQISPSYYAVPPEQRPSTGTVPKDVQESHEKIPLLFQPTEITCGNKKMVLKNRVIVSPMCMYSSVDGFPTPFHLVHHGQFALRGAGAIVVEASGVSPEGRISPRDLGIYKEEHVAAHASLVSSVKSLVSGVHIGIQIAHAGRKASTWPPYQPQPSADHANVPTSEGGWEDNVVGASALPFDHTHVTPKELSLQQIHEVEDDFVRAAERAFRAGYDFVQIHSAHGYLVSSFNSPLTNKRTDEYGGSFENRTRLLLNIVRRIRQQFPDRGVWVRINGTDGLPEDSKDESWTYESTKAVAPLLEQAGVDMLDVSSGGTVGSIQFRTSPGYQVPGAIAAKAGGLQRMRVSSVGALNGGTPDDPSREGLFAEKVLQSGDADFITLGRAFLRNPCWVEDAARNLMGVNPVCVLQYGYTYPRLSPRSNADGKGPKSS